MPSVFVFILRGSLFGVVPVSIASDRLVLVSWCFSIYKALFLQSMMIFSVFSIVSSFIRLAVFIKFHGVVFVV